MQDTILVPNGVNVAAYHGGNLEGPSTRSFVGNAPTMREATKSLLISMFPNDEIAKQDIIEFYDRMQEGIVLFDGFFATLNATAEDWDDNELAGTMAIAEKY